MNHVSALFWHILDLLKCSWETPLSYRSTGRGRSASLGADQTGRPVWLCKLDPRPPDNVSRPDEVNGLVVLIEGDGLDRVADLVLSDKHQDLAQVGIAAPERAVEGLFARNAREQRDIESVADQSHIDIVTADRQEGERQLQNLRGTCAIDDRIDVSLPRAGTELLTDVGRGFAFDVDDVIGPVLFRDGELVGIARERDHLRTAPEELGVLNGVPAEPADAEHPEDPIRGERAGVAEFLDPPVRCHTGIGQRSEFLEFETIVHLDEVASRDGDELGKPAVRTESGPAYVWANVCVSDLAVTAGAVTPPGGDNHVITFLIPHRPGHKPAEFVHDAGDFMPRGDGCRDVSVFPEVSVDELYIGTAHPTRPDLDKHLIGLTVRNGHVVEDEGLAIFVHARCFHVCSPFEVVGFTIQASLGG